jgi:hypothetical protein
VSDRLEAARIVPAPPEEVFGFLSALENHWRLADRWIEVVSLGRSPAAGTGAADRGTVRIRGPLGVKRTAAVRVLAAQPVSSLVGTAELGDRTRARVSWVMEARGTATEVTLTAQVERAGVLDRALLALGGRAWIERRFGSVLDRLAEAVGHAVAAGEADRGQATKLEVSTR